MKLFENIKLIICFILLAPVAITYHLVGKFFVVIYACIFWCMGTDISFNESFDELREVFSV